jgi:hypothetical protein
MGAGNSTANPALNYSRYAALPDSQNGIIEQKYTNRNGKETKLYGFNTSKAYSAPNSTPVEVNETEWIKNNSQSNNKRNVYKHKTINGKLRTNYKHNNGTKRTLYGFNKNKAYVDPTLQELMKITKNSVREMIDNFKDKFKDNEEIRPVIEQLEQEIQPLINKDAPTQKEIEDAEKRIKEIIHYETVTKPQLSQLTAPPTALVETLGKIFIGLLEIASSAPMIGLALLVDGGTRRKRRNRRHRTRRH